MYNTLMADEQPGEVIIPIERNSATQPQQAVALPPVSAVAATDIPAANDQPTPGPSLQHTYPEATPTTEPALRLSSDGSAAQPLTQVPDTYSPRQFDANQADGSIVWQSAEYMAHDKNANWYTMMLIGSVVIAGIVYVLNRDILTAAIVLFALVGLGYFSGRKPREQQFAVSTDGAHVGHNYYPFHNFRSFSVVEDASASSIILMPLKRFMPAVNIYVPAEYEEQVISFIADILPFEQHKTDFAESLMRRIRF